MNRQVIQTDRAPAAIGPYSQAIRTGDLLFISGQIALDPATGELVGPGDVAAQAERVMDNLQAVLEAAGGTFENVVRSTIFLTDLGDFATVNAVYGARFEGMQPPARACVEVSRLPKDVQVEIDMIATLG